MREWHPTIATQFNDCWFVRAEYEQQKIFDYDTDVFIMEKVERHVDTLKDFSLSYIDSDITINENGSSQITIKNQVPTPPNDVTIYKQKAETSTKEYIQTLSPLSDMTLEMPADEHGTVTVEVFSENDPGQLDETVTIPY